MRIISKFKDYYDSAASYGVDLECVYVREQKEVLIPKTARGFVGAKKFPFFVRGIDDSPLVFFVIGFCGELYPLVKVEVDGKIDYCYDLATCENILRSHGYDTNQTRYYSSNHFYTVRDVKDFFNQDFSVLNYVFEEEHCPVFVYKGGGNGMVFSLNERLADYDFFKKKDAPSCFQEIFMYLSGVLGNKEKETLNVDDKTRIQQRGFDKWSFRKKVR